MSTRQPRQPERDIRLHDPHVPHHAHSLPPPPHPHAHPPLHLNGSSIPATPLAAAGAGPPPAQGALVTSPAVANGANGTVVPSSIQKLAQANEQTWLLIGRVAEQMGNLEHALSAYENALRHNPMSLSGLTQVAGIARIKENYPKAVEYFQRVINMQQDNGEVWSALGHCYLMQDDLQKAYAAYQQALYLLPNPKEDPKLWYGIGILYDRYGSLDHAEEAFSSVLRMDKDFDKANEILFRLGIIYKQQGKYQESLECFDRILRNPLNPLAHADIWFQIGHVYEQQHDHVRAREAYERVVADNPGHAKVLQQLGWLYHQDGSSFQNQELAIQYLTKSLEADPADAQSWYLLGRAYMAGQKYNKAYEAYQQAVYRDGRNPTFWCSIGVLYFQINQYRDALDAYSRAIRINPYISEVWFDLGSLYESCNNQISDAIDAYARAAELDPTNQAIAQRLALLKNAQATGSQVPAAPGPQDVHPTAYANSLMPQPAGLTGPPLVLHTNGMPPRPLFRADSRGAPNELPLPIPPAQLQGRSSPGPFRGGPPPPVILNDEQRPQSHILAPMDVDRPPMREQASYREPPRGVPSNSLLLHHPVPQPQPLPQSHQHESFAPRPLRVSPGSASPPPRTLPAFNDRPPVGPGQIPHTRSPRAYPREIPQERVEPGWDRRMPPGAEREWERDHRGRPAPADYPPHPQQAAMYSSRPHSPIYAQQSHRNVSRDRRDSPPEASPRSAHPHPGYPRASSSYWDAKHAGPASQGPGPVPVQIPQHARSPPPPPPSRSTLTEVVLDTPQRRYDPRFDGREAQSREYEREMQVDARYHMSSPEALRMRAQPPPPQYAGSSRPSESPRMGPVGTPSETKSRGGRRKAHPAATPEVEVPGEKKERKRRQRRSKEDTPGPMQPPRQDSQYGMSMPGSYRQKTSSNGSPEPSSHGSGTGSANRSAQPSPTNSVANPAHHPPTRVVDEDYDGDGAAAEVLMNMSSYRGGPSDPRSFGGHAGAAMRSPPDSRVGPAQTSPHSMAKHPAMQQRSSPPSKRPLSPGPEDPEPKRTRVDSIGRRMSSPSAQAPSSTRPSPIPFRQQPTSQASHSPEMRQELQQQQQQRAGEYPPSPPLPTMLPPHPRPIGLAHAHTHTSGPGMPPQRSPPGMSPTDAAGLRDSRSNSPNAQRMPAKREIVVHPARSPPHTIRSPPASSRPKGTPSPASSHGSHGSGGSHKMVVS